MNELTPKDVLPDLLDSDDFPTPIAVRSHSKSS